VYGHEYGLTVLWRGGKVGDKFKDVKPQSSSSYSEIYISEEDLENSKEYELVIKQIHISFGVAVQSLTFPPLEPRSTRPTPTTFARSVIIAAACSDYNIRLMAIPLDPRQSSKDVATVSLQSVPSAVAITAYRATSNDLESDADEFYILVTSHTSDRVGRITFTRLQIEQTTTGLRFSGPPETLHSASVTNPVTAIAFNSSPISVDRHTQLLVATAKGSVRIFDPLLPPPRRRKTARRGSVEDLTPRAGSWLGNFHAPFETSKSVDVAAPATAHRKAILDAAWVSEGRSIIALLSDGEWGIWDVYGGGAGASSTMYGNSSFVVHGFVHGNIPVSIQITAAEAKKPRGKRSSLAPMTPNTRKQKQEDLFRGPTSLAAATPTGGISVQQISSLSGASVEDNVTFWYDNVAYNISSLRSFWARIMKESKSSTGGSLYGPGLSRVDVEIGGERIQTISQLPAGTSSFHPGQKDYLVAGEHRINFLESQLPREPAKLLFTEDSAETSAVDQSLLARGELDIGGLDRMLDSMTADDDVFMSNAQNGGSRLRRVGFAD